ncbi:HD domain-containing protein [Bacillus sp. S70]|uniref:HD domain-containing protein n=1 Tax=Bacillus TaxID=1386 RepID=UPI0018CF4491|nr:HD domain-containing protein [Bacillus cereus]MBJ9981468.1 HD domain-containing protein [Bacillus sp. S29]MBK0102395.1 HD domain-containing protein [Bacillus sp. S70]MBK0107532.1 HD domain-containing protein [Bacillus sp. S73]MBK0136442.1 HD domain-containing protein [Bacillus sp. S72]MBK0149812.1 HD domain-containing protein [Bacillus sp. S74]MBK0159767.1 HD domain-containing protein [Bacillus sp. S71]MCI4249329.1 HD domain-containing protein [Bacillus sp. CCB-MMP212]
MIISDVLYGKFEVDAVLEELFLSKPMQRLKGIHQAGASYLMNEKWNVTRFEHSVGVMLLVKKLGGSVEEQIAGLLHDISHTAFSHVIDYVFDNEDESYHEEIFSSVVKNSEIPAILAKHGYNYEDILLDDSKWTLLERSAPELCADRVDYTLRDMYTYGYISLEEVHSFLEDVIEVEGKMVLQNIEIAEWFTETYYKEVIDFFMEPMNIYGNDMLAKTLKVALHKRIIHADDFLLEDEELISKLQQCNDPEVEALLSKVHQNVKVKEDRNDYDLHQKNKVRLIDPLLLREGKIVQSSVVSEKIRQMSDIAYEKAVRGMYVKVIAD